MPKGGPGRVPQVSRRCAESLVVCQPPVYIPVRDAWDADGGGPGGGTAVLGEGGRSQ